MLTRFLLLALLTLFVGGSSLVLGAGMVVFTGNEDKLYTFDLFSYGSGIVVGHIVYIVLDMALGRR